MPDAIELTADTDAVPVQAEKLYRMRFDMETQQVDAPKQDDASGDVTFGCLAVDKKKAPNRRGFVFDWQKPEDVILDSFLGNPIMLYMHERHWMPMGRWEEVKVTNKGIILTGRIPGGADYDDIKWLRVRVRDGYLKAVSIGFYIRAYEEVKSPTGALLYVRITKLELVECSICTIGAHETALIGQKQVTPIEPDPALAAPTHDFALPAGSRWAAEDQVDAEKGARMGKIFRLSLAQASAPEAPAGKGDESVPAVSAADGDQASAAADSATRAPDPHLLADKGKLDKKTRKMLEKACDACESAAEAMRACLEEDEEQSAPEAEAAAPAVAPTEAQSAPTVPATADSPAPSSASAPTGQEEPATPKVDAQALEPIVRQVVQSVMSRPEIRNLRIQVSQQIASALADANRARRRRHYAS